MKTASISQCQAYVPTELEYSGTGLSPAGMETRTSCWCRALCYLHKACIAEEIVIVHKTDISAAAV